MAELGRGAEGARASTRRTDTRDTPRDVRLGRNSQERRSTAAQAQRPHPDRLPEPARERSQKACWAPRSESGDASRWRPGTGRQPAAGPRRVTVPRALHAGPLSAKPGGGVRFRQGAWVRSSPLAGVPRPRQNNIDARANADQDRHSDGTTMAMNERRRNRGPSPVDRRTACGCVGEGCCRTSSAC